MARSRKRQGISFRDKVSQNMKDSEKPRGSLSYLNLPKGVSLYTVSEAGSYWLDFMLYEVSDERHMDRKDSHELAVQGTEWYKKPFRVHKGVGVERGTVVCPVTFKRPCPICERREKLLKAGKEYKDEAVVKLNFSLRNLYVVIPRGHKDFEPIPHVWDISNYLFQRKLKEETDEDESYIPFADPEDGFVLKVRFSEKAFGKNKYYETSRIDFKDRKKQITEKDMERVPDIDKVLVELSYDEIENLFFEVPVDDDVPTEKDDAVSYEEVPEDWRDEKQEDEKDESGLEPEPKDAEPEPYDDDPPPDPESIPRGGAPFEDEIDPYSDLPDLGDDDDPPARRRSGRTRG